MVDAVPGIEGEPPDDVAGTYVRLFVEWTDVLVSKDITGADPGYELETVRMGAGPVSDLYHALNQALETDQMAADDAEAVWDSTLQELNQRLADQGSRDEFMVFYDFADYGYYGNPVLKRYGSMDAAMLETQDLPADDPRKEFTFYGGRTFHFGEPVAHPNKFMAVTREAFSDNLGGRFSEIIASDWPISFFRNHQSRR